MPGGRMAVSTSMILDVLAAHGIDPTEQEEVDLPGIGEINEGEAVYATSIANVFGGRDEEPSDVGIIDSDDPRFREWWHEIEQIIEGRNDRMLVRPHARPAEDPPEPHCAWYCPVHFFGHGWGIYIRETCILLHATHIAAAVRWSSVLTPRPQIARHLLRSAFYFFFLHEQFHHKVESLGFRLLISTGRDRYRPYKRNVYRPTFLTPDCREESLANAESYSRLGEPRYVKRVDPAIREGLQQYLKISFSLQPPGYREGLNYLSEPRYRAGLQELQSQILDGAIAPSMPPGHWAIAPHMITSLADISDEIYVVLPRGARPIFRPSSIDPGATVSTRALESALTRHYGYQAVPGGKGSHVKMKKPGAPTIILSGNRPVLSPGVVKHALEAFGGYPVSRLPDLLDGKLVMRA
jgi:hypothetical protein